MKSGTFMDIVGFYYDDIKHIFTLRDQNAKRKFNEDAFNESFIRCAKKFENNTVEYDTVIKYFWIAYVNTCKGDYKYESTIELCENYSEEYSEEDDSFSKKFYDYAMNVIENEFGENDMLIYSLYKCHGWTKNELIESGYDCSDFEMKIKNINRFIKNHCKKKFKI